MTAKYNKYKKEDKHMDTKKENCMKMKFKFNADGLITDTWFDGLNGSDRVTSVSEAMTKLRVKNPAVVFTEEAKAGAFDELSDEVYNAILRSVECIALLWRYKGDTPANKSTRIETNVLTLLANAMELLTRQNIQLEKLGVKSNRHDKDENEEEPDWPDVWPEDLDLGSDLDPDPDEWEIDPWEDEGSDGITGCVRCGNPVRLQDAVYESDDDDEDDRSAYCPNCAKLLGFILPLSSDTSNKTNSK